MDAKLLKSQIDPEAFVRDRYNLAFDEKGWSRCPSAERHNNGDANPSFRLDRTSGYFRCWSQGCYGDRGVDLIGFVMKMEGVDFRTATQIVKDWARMDGHPAKQQPVHSERQPGRNDLCSCGSGKKYKKCCGGPKRIVAQFDYLDENGDLLYQILRMEPKDFRARYPDGKGGWIWKRGDRVVPYRLPEVLKSDGPVVIVEGEKCVDVLWDLGIPATCNPFGAGKWTSALSEHLRDRDVIVWADKDEPGFKHAEKVARSLAGFSASTAMVTPPDELQEKGDVADGVSRLCWSRERIQEILDQTHPWQPASESPERSSDGTIGTGPSETKISLQPRSAEELISQAPEVTWQVESILPQGAAMVVVADAGVGKTWMTLDLALAIDQGIPWLAHFPVQQGAVLVIDEENADALLKERLQKLLRAYDMLDDASEVRIEFLTAQGVNLSDEDYVAEIERVLDAGGFKLVIVDSLVRVHQGNENDAGEMARVFGIVKRWIGKYGCSFVFCHHQRKPGMAGNDPANMYRGSSEIRAFVDVHLDLKAVRGEKGVFTVNHVKSRYAEPIPPFNVEIADIGESATQVHYAGEPSSGSQDKSEEAQEFIRSLAADREWHSRQEILEKGGEMKYPRDTLDTARKDLVKAEELVEEKRGKATGIRLPERSDGPVLYIPSERNDAVETDLFPVEEGVICTQPNSSTFCRNPG